MTLATLPQTEDNLHCLRQLQQLIGSLSERLYQRNHHGQTIGQHVRHILDHYDCLFRACKKEAELDYESRPRQLDLEKLPGVALAKTTQLIAQMEELKRVRNSQIDFKVRDILQGKPSLCKTSLVRELAFLASHSVHHLAIIRFLVASSDVFVPADLGVHPSTLRYWASQAEAI